MIRLLGRILTIALAIFGGAVLAARFAAPQSVNSEDIAPAIAVAVDRFTDGPTQDNSPTYLSLALQRGYAPKALLQAIESLQPGRKWLARSDCNTVPQTQWRDWLVQERTCDAADVLAEWRGVPLWRTVVVGVYAGSCSADYVLFKGWSGWFAVSGDAACDTPTGFADLAQTPSGGDAPATVGSDTLPLMSVLVREYPDDVEAAVEFTGDRELLIRTNKAGALRCQFSLPLATNAVRCKPTHVSEASPDSPSVAWERQCLAAKSVPRPEHVARYADDIGVWSARANAVTNWDAEEPWLENRLYLVSRAGCRVTPLGPQLDASYIGIVRQPYAGVVYQQDTSVWKIKYTMWLQLVGTAGEIGPRLRLGIADASNNAPAATSSSGYILSSGGSPTGRGTRYCIHRVVRGDQGPALADRRCGSEDASYSPRSTAISEDGQVFAVVLPGEWVWLYAFGEAPRGAVTAP